MTDGAGRGGAVAVETIANETPVEQRPSLAAATLTGALILKGTYRTVGSICFRLWVDLRIGFLRSAPKKVESEEGGR